MDKIDVTICVVIGFILGALVNGILVANKYKDNAIERGYALYCPGNGKFAWTGECE